MKIQNSIGWNTKGLLELLVTECLHWIVWNYFRIPGDLNGARVDFILYLCFCSQWFVVTAYLRRRYYVTPSKNDGNQWNASAERRCRFSHWMAILLKPNLLHLPNQTTESQWSLSHCSSEDFEGAIRGALRKHGHILLAAVCVAQEYQKKYMQEGGRVVHYCKQSLRCFRWRFMVDASITDMSPTQETWRSRMLPAGIFTVIM